MYHYETYYSDTINDGDLKNIEEFVREAEHSDEPAAVNMGWEPPAGLLYNIRNRLRWRSDQGQIVVITDQSKNVAISCVEYPEGDYTWAIGGIRTWITPEYRSRQIAHHFLSVHYKWAKIRGCKFLLLTFNEYNKSAWHAIKEPKFRKAANWSSWWDDCLAVEEPLIIRNTTQWVVIKPVICRNNQQNKNDLLAWSAKINTV